MVDLSAKSKTTMSAKMNTRNLSVRKVVPILTSTSVEIYLSMAGAKQLGDTRFIQVPVGPYV
jgi:hypothetical protein